MISHLSRWTGLALLAFVLCGPSPVAAQPYPGPNNPSVISVRPAHLFRFRISNLNLGYLLTPIYSEGVFHNYTFERSFSTIFPVVPGYEPDPSTMLVPLHQWTVIEHGRPYAAYSTYYTAQGSNYHYDGVRGYIYHQNGPGIPIGIYYSQSKGFFYGYGTPGPVFPDSPPSGAGYVFHGVLGNGLINLWPTGQFPSNCPTNDFCYLGPEYAVQYNQLPPPPPPPPCDLQEESDCWGWGGEWDTNSCSCRWPSGCDPREEQICYSNGGWWNNCQCYYSW